MARKSRVPGAAGGRPDRANGTACEALDFQKFESSVGRVFEETAARFGDRRAVKAADADLTYDQLNRLTNRIAHAILDRRAEAREAVLVVLSHDTRAAAAILACLKTARMYVPIAPEFPAERAQFMLKDSGARIVITDSDHLSLAKGLAADESLIVNVDKLDGSEDNPGVEVGPDDYTSILYTSGSTGEPKGVVDTHRKLLYEAFLRVKVLGLTSEDGLSCTNQFCFAGSIRKFYPAIVIGASSHLYDVKLQGVAAFASWLVRDRITVTGGRSVLREILAGPAGRETYPDMRIVTMGGDTIYRRDVELARKYFEPEFVCASLGSTEGGSVAGFTIRPGTKLTDKVVPVGWAVEGKKITLIDDDGAAVGPGTPGEITLQSRYLAAGYWHRDDLTAETFLPAPEAPGERIFLSGDMGRMDEDGCIMHIGRKDFQVKIRGYRVETPEVESALLENFKPVEAVVVGRGAPGEKQLVAYMVPGDQTPRDVSSIRRRLAERLPEYMVPTRCVFVEKLPRTVTGKVHRRELPEPPSTRPTLEVEFAPPRTPLEEEIAGIWSEVLGISPVGVNDSFLDLGGHSLRAAQVAARISERHDLQLALPTVLQCATVAELALAVAERMAGGADAAALDSILSDLENTGGGPSAQDV